MSDNSKEVQQEVVEQKVLSREALLAKQDLAVEWVPLDEEGGGVFVKEMSARERDAWEASMLEEHETDEGTTEYKTGFVDFRAKLAVRTCVDDKGSYLFLEEDAEELSKNMGAKRMEMIVNVAQRLNKISKKDREDLEKKLKGKREKNSNSASA